MNTEEKQEDTLKLSPEEEEAFQKKMEEILEYYKNGGTRGIKHSIKFNKLARKARKNRRIT